jgi:hypothetical protein
MVGSIFFLSSNTTRFSQIKGIALSTIISSVIHTDPFSATPKCAGIMAIYMFYILC